MSEADTRPWKMATAGVSVRVRLTPKAAKDGIEGIEPTPEGPALKARVRAVPSEGAANTAIIAVLAKWLGVPKTSVALTHGGKSRVKVLMVAGDPVAIVRRLEAQTVRK